MCVWEEMSECGVMSRKIPFIVWEGLRRYEADQTLDSFGIGQSCPPQHMCVLWKPNAMRTPVGSAI